MNRINHQTTIIAFYYCLGLMIEQHKTWKKCCLELQECFQRHSLGVVSKFQLYEMFNTRFRMEGLNVENAYIEALDFIQTYYSKELYEDLLKVLRKYELVGDEKEAELTTFDNSFFERK